jgi:hypothetical protein
MSDSQKEQAGHEAKPSDDLSEDDKRSVDERGSRFRQGRA